MEIKRPLGRFAKSHPTLASVGEILANPWAIPLEVIFIVLTVALGASILSDNPRERSMSAFLRDIGEHLASLVGNPWVQAGYAALAFYGIWMAARGVVAKKRSIEETETAARAAAVGQIETVLAAFRNDLRPHFEIVRGVGEIVAREHQLAAAKSLMAGADEQFRTFIGTADGLAAPGLRIPFSDMPMGLHSAHGANTQIQMSAARIDSDIVASLEPLLAMDAQKTEQTGAFPCYCPENNQRFVNNLNANVQILIRNTSLVRARLDKEEEDITKMKEQLWTKFQAPA